jgi:hypothetical protein
MSKLTGVLILPLAGKTIEPDLTQAGDWYARFYKKLSSFLLLSDGNRKINVFP